MSLSLFSESKDNWGFWPATKYDKALFYLAPFYHLVLPFDKFIVVDADIEFKYRVEGLHDVFSDFEEEHLYSLGKDLSPFYRSMLYQYRFVISFNPKDKLLIAAKSIFKSTSFCFLCFFSSSY